jgi:dTDP-4-amino-4,6-dideoxy-D-galactose acyltransferase
MSGPRIELLDWDTHFWGVKAARLHVVCATDLVAADLLAQEKGIQWASCQIPSNNTELLNFAIRSGHVVVDYRHALEITLDPHRHNASWTDALRSDEESLATIARTAFSISRFYEDPQLPNQRCDDFYELWLRNSFNGPMADGVVVIRDANSNSGFVTIKLDAHAAATLPLVAVRQDARGKGAGGAVISSALAWANSRGCKTVSVVTQLSNLPAIRLYESMGFRSIESAVWTHRWYGDPGARAEAASSET